MTEESPPRDSEKWLSCAPEGRNESDEASLAMLLGWVAAGMAHGLGGGMMVNKRARSRNVHHTDIDKKN